MEWYQRIDVYNKLFLQIDLQVVQTQQVDLQLDLQMDLHIHMR